LLAPGCEAVSFGALVDAIDAIRSTLAAQGVARLDRIALVAAREDRFADAALITGYCDHIRAQRHVQPDPAEGLAINETRMLLQQRLGNERLEELLHAGALMSEAEVQALAVPD